jgi:ABC-type antimicrobial peptide transport system ATPase subunit
VGKDRDKFLAEHKCSLVLEKPEKDLIGQRICPICNEKMRASAPVFFDDIPLMNLKRYNAYTLIDKQMAPFFREQEGSRLKRTYSNLSEWAIEELIKEIVKDWEAV